MHNKKTIIRTFLLITTILLTSCSMNHNQYNRLSVGTILNHTEKLADFDSPYTLCVKNEDETYSFFIFASPIQYKEEQNYIMESQNPAIPMLFQLKCRDNQEINDFPTLSDTPFCVLFIIIFLFRTKPYSLQN